MKVYIAGKVTGEPLEECMAKFQDIEDQFHKEGIPCINPFKLGIPETATWEEALPICLKEIEENASAIFMLTDWRDSLGARKELHEAMDQKKRIYFQEGGGFNFVLQEINHGHLKIKRIPEKERA